MKLEIGKIYKVNHSRKGVFTVRVTSQCDTWTTGTVIDGETQAMLDYNKSYEGDEVSFRSEWTRKAEEVSTAANA